MIRCAACGEWTKEPSLCRGAQGIAGGVRQALGGYVPEAEKPGAMAVVRRA